MKAWDLVLLGLLSSLAAIGIDAVVPIVDAISAGAGTAPKYGALTISVFVAGMACGELVAGPLSDSYGRKAVLVPALLVFALSSLSLSITNDLSVLITLRFLQALSGGAASAMTILLITDRFDLAEATRMLSIAMIVAMAARVAAPVLSFQLSDRFGWESVFIVLTIVGLVLLVYFQTSSAHDSDHQGHGELSARRILAEASGVLNDHRARLYVAAECATSIGLFAYVSGAAGLVVSYLDISESDFSIIFALGTVLTMLGASVNARIVPRLGLDRTMALASWGMVLAAALLSITLLSQSKTPFVVITPLLAFLPAMIMVRINSNTGCVKRFENHAGIASSIISTLGLGTGAIFAFFAGTLLSGSYGAIAAMYFSSAIICLCCSKLLVDARPNR